MSNVMVQVESEGGTQVVSMTPSDAARMKDIMIQAMPDNEWPDEADEILDRSPAVDLYGIVNTYGDGCGWFEVE